LAVDVKRKCDIVKIIIKSNNRTLISRFNLSLG
jgi:hypothetical protein